MVMDYSGIVSSTFDLLKKNKYLWWVGVGISFAGNIGNLPNIIIYNTLLLFLFANMFNNSENTQPYFLEQQGADLVIIICVAFFIFLFIMSLYLAAVAKAGMIKAIHNNISNYQEIWKEGNKNWLKIIKIGAVMFSFMLTLMIPFFVLIILMSAVEDNEATTAIIGVLVCCLYIPLFLGMVLGMVTVEFSIRNAVLHNQKTLIAIKNALKLIKANIGKVALSYLIFYGISLLSIVLMMAAVIAAFIVDIIVAFIGYPVLLADGIGSLIVALLAGILVWFVLVIVSGPVWAFYEVYWNKVYEAIRGD